MAPALQSCVQQGCLPASVGPSPAFRRATLGRLYEKVQGSAGRYIGEGALPLGLRDRCQRRDRGRLVRRGTGFFFRLSPSTALEGGWALLAVGGEALLPAVGLAEVPEDGDGPLEGGTCLTANALRPEAV